MKCPYCSKEMASGFLKSSHFIHWGEDKSLGFLSNDLKLTKLSFEGTLKGNRIVYLDCIQDPGNLGTIIRSCVAFNIDTLILSKDCVDLYNSKVIRATQGLVFHMNILIEDVEKIVPKLKDEGYKIYGTNVKMGKSLKSVAKAEKFVIIMGNEGNGIGEVSSELCDEFLYIDMNDNCESLNVGVATSIILYEMDK